MKNRERKTPKCTYYFWILNTWRCATNSFLLFFFSSLLLCYSYSHSFFIRFFRITRMHKVMIDTSCLTFFILCSYNNDENECTIVTTTSHRGKQGKEKLLVINPCLFSTSTVNQHLHLMFVFQSTIIHFFFSSLFLSVNIYFFPENDKLAWD